MTLKNQCNRLKPSIAVVIPFYNGDKYWAELVDSLQTQTSKLDEAVIVLDGENQCLPEINLNEIAHKVKIVKLRQNKGVANARNTGIDAVESDYIFFLDQDDFFYPNRVEEVRRCIEKDQAKWLINSYKMVDDLGDTIKVISPGQWLQSFDENIRLKNQITLSNGMARISAICCKKNSLEKFNPEMGSCDDFLFIFHLLEISAPRIVDITGNARRYHDNNQSQSKSHRKSKIKVIAVICKKYNLDKLTKKMSISRLCCDIAIESMIYGSRKKAINNFARSWKIYRFNYKALIGLIICKLTNNPVKLINFGKSITSFLRFSKSKKVIGT